MVPWLILKSLEQIEEILTKSNEMPVLVFKHSDRCGVSSASKSDLDRDWDLRENEIVAYYLDVVENRAVSDEVAKRFGVRHESPQVLVIRDGAVVHTSSHWDISVRELRTALK